MLRLPERLDLAGEFTNLFAGWALCLTAKHKRLLPFSGSN
jgi:hypothetical protein